MPILIAAVALLGLAVDSFLNVVIRLVPRGESLLRPASHCPSCNEPVRNRPAYLSFAAAGIALTMIDLDGLYPAGTRLGDVKLARRGWRRRLGRVFTEWPAGPPALAFGLPGMTARPSITAREAS